MLNKNSALLLLSVTLLFSLVVFDVGHAFSIESKRDARTVTATEVKETPRLPIKQVSITPKICGGRTAARCSQQSPPRSGETAKDGSLYTSTSMLR
jgi:hypothetical protein